MVGAQVLDPSPWRRLSMKKWNGARRGGWGFHWGSSIKHSTPNLYVQSSFSYRERETKWSLGDQYCLHRPTIGSIFFLSLNIIILCFFLSCWFFIQGEASSSIFWMFVKFHPSTRQMTVWRPANKWVDKHTLWTDTYLVDEQDPVTGLSFPI